MRERLIIKEWYNKNIYKYSKGVSASYVFKEGLDLFVSLIQKKGKILDIGSGLGQDTEYLSRKNYMAVGADFSKEMIKYSLDKRKSGIFINIDFFNIREIFGNHFFNGLWMSSSILTHIEKKEINKFFKEAKKLLLHNGVLGMIIRKDKFNSKREITFNNFSKKDTISMITKNGFRIIKFKELKIEKSNWFFVISKVNR